MTKTVLMVEQKTTTIHEIVVEGEISDEQYDETFQVIERAGDLSLVIKEVRDHGFKVLCYDEPGQFGGSEFRYFDDYLEDDDD